MGLPDIVKKDFIMVYRNKIKLLCVLVVVLMPLAYGFLYLWASWDPYSNMKNVPVAVVNQDAGALYKNKLENFGQQVTDKMIKEKVVDWQMVNLQEAKTGLDSQKYYAIVFIPSDFSARSVSAAGDKPESARIEWQTKDSTSYLFTKYFDAVMKEVAKNINEEMAGRFKLEAEKQASDLTNKIEQASNGAGSLANGLNTLENGSKTLSDNLDKVHTGSEDLNNGLSELNSKSYDLSSGIAKAKDGIASLNTGLSSASAGAESLNNGLSSLQSGSQELKNGTRQAYSGASQLAGGTSQMYDKFNSIDQSLNPFYPTLDNIGQLVNDLNKGAVASTSIPNYVSDAKTKKNELLAGQKQIASGASALTTGLEQLDSGANSLATGISSAKTGSESLSSGINQLYYGSNDLANGLDDLYSGSSKFSEGTGKAYNGGTKLVSGLSQLADGGKQLTSGLDEARNGANTLNNKLAEGSQEIKDKLGNEKVDELVQVINEPVILTNVSVDTNSSYGSALTPYFISLALWMGALMMTLLVPTRDTKLIINNVSRQKITWQKAVLPLTIGFLQTGALLFAVLVGLELHVKYLLPFILFCLLTSFCFIAIMQFISYRLDKIGEFIGIMIMLIQLTSSSGTFPVQSTPRIFQILSPLSPMNYAIKGMRLLILGGPVDIIIKQALVLACMTVIFIILKSLRTKKTVTASELYPLIEL